jgi:LysR family transcriptional activator of mexEF-oprN operon
MNLMMLATLEALILYKKTTLAAEKLGIAQPSVSWYLKQMRELTGDDLFVRTAKGMEPTGFCRSYYLEAKNVLDSMELLSQRRNIAFDPLLAAAEFTVAIPFFKARMLLEGLSVSLMSKYPLLKTDMVYLRETEALEHLETGLLDIYIGVISEKLIKEFAAERVLKTELLVLCSDKSKLFKKGRVSKREYLDTPSIKVAAGFEPSILDVKFKQRGLLQRKLVSVPDIGSEIILLRETDFLLVIDRTDAEIIMAGNKFKILTTDFELPQLDFYAVWHTRKKNDAAHRWFREYLKQHCQDFNKDKRIDSSRFTA